MPVRRLEAESVRDAILATSGGLNLRMFGAPVPVTPDEDGQVIVGVDNRDTAGRPVGKRAAIGSLEDIAGIVAGVAGTSVVASAAQTFAG